ncbi:hypothetical protein [Citrobacter amalonaticus]|uniref:hypothetical protein n=1 Tax=Citrobacter amalonaticus TaxID=35703 RepID=UPI00387E0E19
MITITKDSITDTIEGLEQLSNRGIQSVYIDMAIAGMRRLLTSFEAEPIGAFHIVDQQVSGTSDYIKDGEWPIDNGVIEVYAAPPAPVVPDDLAKAFISAIEKEQERLFDEDYLMDSKDCVDVIREEAQRLNACRAAMLNQEKNNG